MHFKSLLDPGHIISLAALADVQHSANNWQGTMGCGHCPLDGKARKVINTDKIRGRKIFVWAQAPGANEDEQGRELIGPAGKLLWRELGGVGIERDDCDIQNVVRCRPVGSDGKDRKPSDKEVHCCREYTHKALKRSRATVHLVLGEVAARALLGKEYRKDRVALWSEKLHAHVVLTYHPSYLLRGAPIEKKREFRRALRAVAVLQHCRGEFGILRYYNYGELKSAAALKRYLIRIAATGERIAVDVEDVNIQGYPRRLLCCAFCHKPGHARVVFLDHPDRKISKAEYKARLDVLREFMENLKVEKIFHHGNHDVDELKRRGIHTRGYTYDTEYAAYLLDPNSRKYGLDNLSNNMVPQFAGYKALPQRRAKRVQEKSNTTLGSTVDGREIPDYSTVPATALGRYNCADVDLSKRIEVATRDKISLPLLQVFIHCGFVVDDMQANGPHFDYQFYDTIKKLLPDMIRQLRSKIRSLTYPSFNPGSQKQVAALVYDSLGIPLYEDKKKKKFTRDTGSKVLEQLKDKHPIIGDILEYRRLTKLHGTYLMGYHASAERYAGHVRTKWWLTGTITGRMRSGSGNAGIVNLQNIANDPVAKNLLVSDRRWRAIEAALLSGEDPERILKMYGDMTVFLALDYSGIEVRILAEITGDPALLDLFDKGFDIHSLVGEELTGIPAHKIKEDKKTRVMIKGFHFGLMYGQSSKQMYEKMKEQFIKMKIPRKDWPTLENLKEFQVKYFKKFKRVKIYIDKMHVFAVKHGYVPTMFGFRRPIWANVADDERGTFWENQAINSPIQGSAHQLLLMCMAILHRKPKTYHLLQNLTLEIHDSIYFQVPLNRLSEAYVMAKELMEKEVARYVTRFFKRMLRVPLVSEAEAGFRLGAMISDKDVAGKGNPPNMNVVEFLPKWLAENKKSDTKLREKYHVEKAA